MCLGIGGKETKVLEFLREREIAPQTRQDAYSRMLVSGRPLCTVSKTDVTACGIFVWNRFSKYLYCVKRVKMNLKRCGSLRVLGFAHGCCLHSL